jgi:hypothetical protein|tara:strand:- start:447 stop:605 length:159 start_codon:yes stop_codon:yes gene_type:complete
MKFSELLNEYLEERDRQTSNYYDNMYIGSRSAGYDRMAELEDQMDLLIGVNE